MAYYHAPASAKFYIATRLENADGHRRVRALLEGLGHILTYDWTTHGSVQDEGVDRMAAVASFELQGVREADVVVVLLPGGRGTHTELGIALATPNTKVLVFAADAAALGERHCAFYHAPGVELVVGDLADLLVAFERLRVTR